MKYIIYKISIADFTYIGSTRDLKQRIQTHKSSCYNEHHKEHNKKLYQTIRENGRWDCIDITPVEEYECETTQQARIREEYWRRQYDAQLNAIRAHRTEEDKKQRERDRTRTEEQLERRRQKSAERFAANREELNKKRKDLYYANRDDVLNKMKEKIQCECGATICRAAKSGHLRSKKHIDRIAEQQKQNITVL